MQHLGPAPKAQIQTFVECEDGQWKWDARSLQDDEILTCFERSLQEARSSKPGSSPALQITFIEIEDKVREPTGRVAQQQGPRRTIWLKALQLLNVPGKTFKHDLSFSRLPARLSEASVGIPSFSNARVYRVTTGRFDMVWACEMESQAISGLLAYSGRKSEFICNSLQKDLYVHRSLVKHRMLLALLAHVHITLEMEDRFNMQIDRVIDTMQDTGFHADMKFDGTIPQSDETDLGERSAKVSGMAANLVTTHLRSQGLLGLADFIQLECGRLALESSNESSAGFLQSNRYIMQHAKCCALRSTAHRDEAASWRKQANIQVRGIFNLIAQRDQSQNIKIADASRALAEATKRDSTSMKALAVVTMCFLPGTFLAVRAHPSLPLCLLDFRS